MIYNKNAVTKFNLVKDYPLPLGAVASAVAGSKCCAFLWVW